MPFRSRPVHRTASGRVPQPQAGKQVGTAEAEEAEEAVAARVLVHLLYEKEFVIVSRLGKRRETGTASSASSASQDVNGG